MWRFPDLRNQEWVWMKLTHVTYLGQDAEVPAEGAVPPVVAPVVMAHPDIHAVLAICGFANVMDHTLIINNEGFQLIVDFGILKDKEVFEMVKHLGNCTEKFR
jgi:hypothetical protein